MPRPATRWPRRTPKPPQPMGADKILYLASVAGCVDRTLFEAGVQRLRDAGFRVGYDESLLETQHPYLAADAEVRAADLEQAFLDPDVGAVLCIRGGYGSMHLLDHLDVDSLVATRKPFAGYSDNTALHMVLNRCGLMTYHAPVVTALGRMSEREAIGVTARLKRVLCGEVRGTELLCGTRGLPGRATGPLCGGNLSLVVALQGALPIPRGAVLLLEDVGEPLYRIDRMITGLKLAGVFDKLSGVALGSFARCGREHREHTTPTRLILSLLSDVEAPVVGNLRIGHHFGDMIVPLGVDVTIDGHNGTLSVNWG